MALYMPTNITPSTLGAIGNGTVDAKKGIDVSWQVDGQNAMTAFQIKILANTTDSAVLYNTGKKTEGCPFYGRDEKGDVVFFQYAISASVLASAKITNGKNYKLLITQWWNDNQSVTQQSASVFLCRDTPTLQIGDWTAPGTLVPLHKTVETFTATYNQAQGDELAWVRWRLWRYDKNRILLADTGAIATSMLQFRYDSFFDGEKYLLECEGETTNGVPVYASKQLKCSYDVSPFSGFVQTCVDRKKSGVKLSWPEAIQISGTAIGEYAIEKKKLILLSGSSVYWSPPPDVSWFPPVSIVWKGLIREIPANVFQISVMSADKTSADEAVGLVNAEPEATSLISVVTQADKISVVWREKEIGRVEGKFLPNDELTIVLTGENLYVYRVYENGMYPSELLFPQDDLFPLESNIMEDAYTGQILIPEFKISSFRLVGPQVCNYFWVKGGDIPENVLHELIGGGGYSPAFGEDTWLLANFENELQAGTVQTSEGVSHWDVYRMDDNEQVFSFVSRVYEGREVIDCAVASQHSYTYYIFGVTSEDKIATQALRSKPVEVCLWDWTLLVCEEDVGKGYNRSFAGRNYTVSDIFRFSLNVESGTIGNNNAPNLLANFTRYPMIQQTPQRYMSGTLAGCLGSVDSEGNYKDTIERRDALLALSQTTKTLFLKNRKGDLLQIFVCGQITFKTQDATRQQLLTCSVPWAETGDAKDTSIFIRKGDALWGM